MRSATRSSILFPLLSAKTFRNLISLAAILIQLSLKPVKSLSSIRVIREDICIWVWHISNRAITRTQTRSCGKRLIYLKGTVQYLAPWGTVTQCPEDVSKRWRFSKSSRKSMEGMRRSARTSLPFTPAWAIRTRLLRGWKRTFRLAVVCYRESDGMYPTSRSAATRATPICCVEWACSHEVAKVVIVESGPPAMNDQINDI